MRKAVQISDGWVGQVSGLELRWAQRSGMKQRTGTEGILELKEIQPSLPVAAGGPRGRRAKEDPLIRGA